MKPEENEKPDRILLVAVLALLLIGTFMVFSASSFRAEVHLKSSTYFLKRHLFKIGLGLVLMCVCSRMNYHWFRWIMPFSMILGMAALVAVLALPRVNNVHRSIGIMGIGLQPSEFMKLVLVFYLAAVFSRGRSRAYETSYFAGHTFILLFIVSLVFMEPDLGTSLVLFTLGIVLFYLSGIQWKRLLILSGGVMVVVALGTAIHPYMRERMTDYIYSLTGNGPMSYHVKQSLIGLSQGGLFGVGPGIGKQKLFFLPEPYNDFILSCLGEEFGLFGIAVLFLLLSVVLWRGIHIAMHARDRYGFLMAGGISAMILINAIINAGVVVNLLPTTGLPFPFISYGGSSLMTHLIGVGILLNISKQPVMSYKKFTQVRGRMNPHAEGLE